ncbi:MAG: glycosyltransferase family 2 protein [Atopobiaceae bacterium]|jgi:glycosyltransferase involved in cell wall biosynthesis|nr:glycosyltransferase family 2 protein [Atopobiaceae bacterium]
MKILAIIPAYNEEACLANTVNELTSICPNIDYLIVNDGSIDSTPDICDMEKFNHIDMPINTGLTSGFHAGMKYALKNQYEAVVQFDADGQHKPEYIPLMAKQLQTSHCDIVIGSRYLSGEQAHGLRNMGSRLISHLIHQTTGAIITDPTSGMRMYGKQMIKTFARGFDLGPEPDSIALLIRNGAKVTEIPVSIRDRQGGESYLKPAKAAKYMLRMCVSLLLFQRFR